MTVKQFFKSSAFKCIIALLCVLLVSGVFLTVAYGFLEVTAGEKLQRAVKKIYPDKIVTIYGLDENGAEKVINEKDSAPQSFVKEVKTVGNSEITECYKIVYSENGKEILNYLVTSVGKGGYGGGTVTCSVAIIVEDGEIAGIYKVAVTANSGQSFINKITGEHLGSFAEGFDTAFGEEGGGFSTESGYISSGATRSSNALNNSVNGAVKFVDAEILGHTGGDKYRFASYVNLKETTYDAAGREFTVVTSSNGLEPNAFTVSIKVSEDKKIESFNILVNGSTSDRYKQQFEASLAGLGSLVGKDLSFFTGLCGENMEYPGNNTGTLVTGATQSTFIVLNACAFALANIDVYIADNAGGNA